MTATAAPQLGVYLAVLLLRFSQCSVRSAGSGEPVSLVVLVALRVCLIPTTIAGLLSAIGVAGMSRLMQANVIATSGRAVEAAGDVDVLLLDKTGTITLGNRQASAFIPAPGVTGAELADAAQRASLLRRNLLIYGLGGVIAPFIGSKLIDLLIAAIGLV